MASMMPIESKLNRRPAGEDPPDEACFLAELRLKVEAPGPPPKRRWPMPCRAGPIA